MIGSQPCNRYRFFRRGASKCDKPVLPDRRTKGPQVDSLGRHRQVKLLHRHHATPTTSLLFSLCRYTNRRLRRRAPQSAHVQVLAWKIWGLCTKKKKGTKAGREQAPSPISRGRWKAHSIQLHWRWRAFFGTANQIFTLCSNRRQQYKAFSKQTTTKAEN